jgi:hypothetical protein
MMRKLLKRSSIAVLVLLLLLKVPIPTSWADIAATPGSGVNLAYKLIGTANYAASLICDAVLGETQCATVTPQNALKVDNSAVTQPVSAAALPLPAGAATAALQAGVSTAAFQATNTATTAHTCAVAGYSEIGCLGQIDDDVKATGLVNPGTIGLWGIAPSTQNSTIPTNGQLSLGQFNTTPTTITTGNVSPFQLDANGNLLVNVKAGGAGGGAITAAASSYAAGAFSIGAGVDGWNITEGTKADAAWTSGSGSAIAILKTIAGNSSSPTGSSSQYPVGALPITASATGTTAATTATLAASVSLKTYICWMSIRANATAAITTNSTVTGTVSGTLNFMQWTAPLASGIGLTEMVFNPCIPSSAINTAINVISAPPGAGGLVSVAAGGYQL